MTCRRTDLAPRALRPDQAGNRPTSLSALSVIRSTLPVLRAPLGQGHLLAQSGDWRLWLLNAEAACLWDWCRAGLDAEALAERLSSQAGLTPESAREQIDTLLRDWRRSGLLDRAAPPDPEEAAWGISPLSDPCPPWPADTLNLVIGDVRLGLWIEDDPLRQALWPLIAPLHANIAPTSAPLLSLLGSAEHWALQWNHERLETGRGRDAAVLAILRELTERACRAAERLLVVHGAGVVGPDGAGLLLIAPGGSGKTTLAAALNAEGLPLLHDDVVPVTLDGDLLGLGLPITLKAGSWPILQTLRPDLSETPIRQRLGHPVRLLPPRGQPVMLPISLGVLVFPRYLPGAPAHVERLTPEAALQGVIEAEAVIRQLTQDKLERLARWVESAPAWSLTYPDLASGLTGIRRILGQPSGA